MNDRVSLLEKWSVPVKVLDHGRIEVLDVMGTDASVVEAARVSYQQGTRAVNEDRGLIRYLMRHRHTTPFEMCEVKLRVKLPIFVERQWVRHRMSSTNEMSARYSELPEEFYIPVAEQVCYQTDDNKQGRSGPLPESEAFEFQENLNHVSTQSFVNYKDDLKRNVARETARVGLPLGTYTEKIWKIDLKNLLDFISLRADSHAQWEIQQYAIILEKIVSEFFPLVHEAFIDFRREAHTFSRQEMLVLRMMSKYFVDACISDDNDVRSELKSLFDYCGVESKRERGAFIKALGIVLK